MQNAPLIEHFTRGHGWNQSIPALAEKARADLDTYYLSPQGHGRWRKFVGKTYDEYPYRRVTSIGMVSTKQNGQLTACHDLEPAQGAARNT
jgi:hypothetical protein